MVVITAKNWKELKQKQAELGKLIFHKSQPDFPWVSRFNAERLKLALLVEVGEFANEIKSFKVWHKKPEVDWSKAQEELIDCLCFFLDLTNLYRLEPQELSPIESQDQSETKFFNTLLLELFTKTNDLYLLNEENLYQTGQTKIPISKRVSYFQWLETFLELCEKLSLNETQILNIYLEKNKINQSRARAE